MWKSEEEFTEYQVGLENKSLMGFYLLFKVLSLGSSRNKITRDNDKYVIKLYPSPPDTPAEYTQYCKYALMKYHPWSLESRNTCKQLEEIDDAGICNLWEFYIQSIEASGDNVPDFLQRAIKTWRL